MLSFTVVYNMIFLNIYRIIIRGFNMCFYGSIIPFFFQKLYFMVSISKICLSKTKTIDFWFYPMYNTQVKGGMCYGHCIRSKFITS